jgi:hypothetical protein
MGFVVKACLKLRYFEYRNANGHQFCNAGALKDNMRNNVEKTKNELDWQTPCLAWQQVYLCWQ